MTARTLRGDRGDRAAATAADQTGSFSLDVERRTIGDAISSYRGRLKSGDPGALPSVLGLVMLVVIFSQVSPRFLTANNIGNLPGQGAYIALIALGLIFVLLLGEIDLSAGTCRWHLRRVRGPGGVLRRAPSRRARSPLRDRDRVDGRVDRPGSVAEDLHRSGHRRHRARHHVHGARQPRRVRPRSSRSRWARRSASSSGFMVARVGIPSFIVTLALFLTWQGVLLFVLGSQPISISSYPFWNGLAQRQHVAVLELGVRDRPRRRLHGYTVLEVDPGHAQGALGRLDGAGPGPRRGARRHRDRHRPLRQPEPQPQPGPEDRGPSLGCHHPDRP